MSMKVVFKPGEFQTLIATRDFTLGDIGVKINKGSDLEYDGTVLVYQGARHNSHKFRGVVAIGWAVLPEEYDPESVVERVSAGIQVRSAEGGNPSAPVSKKMAISVAAEDQVVSNVAKHSKTTRDRNNGLPLEDLGVVREVGHVAFKTPTHQSTDVEKNYGSAKMAAENIKIVAGVGRTRDQLIEGLDPEERVEYLTKVRTLASSKDGVTVSAGSTDITDLTAVVSGSPNDIVVEESEGIRFTKTNTSKMAATPVKKTAAASKAVTASPSPLEGDHRRKIAKAVCAEFPDNYRFEDSAKKKLARLQADYDERPDIIRAVAAAESDDFKRVLVEEFPQAFA